MDDNYTNCSHCNETFEEPYDIPTTRYAVPIVFGIIFIAGFMGNGTLMFIVARNKSMRSVPNIFIFSLALGDFILILTSVPMSATIYTVKSWPYGWFMCKVNYYMQAMSLIVTVFTLTALSVERVMAIIRPMSKRLGDPKTSTIFVACGIWFLGVVLAIPDGVTSHLDVYEDGLGNRLFNCFNYDPSWKSYSKAIVTVKFVVLFIVPLMIISACYVCMAVALITSSQRMPGDEHGNASHRKMIAARRKVAGIVLSFSVLFFVCWLPRHIYFMWYQHYDGDFSAFWYYFKVFAFVMCFLNSCVNPVALYFLSAQFRNYYHRYLCFGCNRRRRSNSEQTSTLYNFNSAIRRNSTSMSAVQTQC